MWNIHQFVELISNLYVNLSILFPFRAPFFETDEYSNGFLFVFYYFIFIEPHKMCMHITKHVRGAATYSKIFGLRIYGGKNGERLCVCVLHLFIYFLFFFEITREQTTRFTSESVHRIRYRMVARKLEKSEINFIEI